MSSKRYSDYDLAVIRRRQGEDIPLPPKPKKRSNEESLFQQAAVRWWAVVCGGYGLPEIALMAHPMQGQRAVINATRMKNEGCRKGTLDMQLTVARGEFHGLWIENKTAIGKLSEEQHAFTAHLSRQRYFVTVCRSLLEVQRCITTYLAL